MATIGANNHLEMKHFNNFRQYIKCLKSMNQKDINTLSRKGLIQVSTGLEEALANVGGHKVVSINSHDLWHPIHGPSEAKLSCARECSNGKKWSAPIKNIFGKMGPIRCQVYERRKNKYYYFVIPQSAHSVIGKNSNIEIPFDLKGNPKKSNHWWKYEVKNFNELATYWP